MVVGSEGAEEDVLDTRIRRLGPNSEEKRVSEDSGRDRGSLSNSSRLGSEAEFTTQENKLPLLTDRNQSIFSDSCLCRFKL